MFAEIVSNLAWPRRRHALVGPEETATWGELAERAQGIEKRHPQLLRRRVGLVFRATPFAVAALAALDRLHCETILLDGRLQSEEAACLGEQLRLGVIVTAEEAVIELGAESAATGETTVTILTSGTTGSPKLVRHTWRSLFRPTRLRNDPSAPRWLLTYRPHLYAGLQVMLQCLTNGGTLIAPKPDTEPSATAELMLAERVTAASATPSYWRRLLLFADHEALRQVPLAQITLGGEVVDQLILDSLRQVFPKARIVHIYATTELGRCFAVTDGRAGFPVDFLNGPTRDGVELRLVNGELVVRSANAMLGYEGCGEGPFDDDTWYPTGDHVETRGDRVCFVGRRSDRINVGGDKVYPLEVERVVRSVSGVADARVFGQYSSIAGQVVACQVVPQAGADAGAVRQAIHETCLSRLLRFQRPRLIDFVDQITLEDSGKMKRKPT